MTYEILKKMQAANRNAADRLQYGHTQNPLNENADMTNTLHSAVFAAAMHIAGKKDVRHYLNGLLIEPGRDGAVCVATDGRRLLVIRTNVPWSLGSVIVPRAACEHIAKIKGPVQFEGEGERFAAVSGSAKYGFTPIDGRFPEWRAVFPHDRNEVQATGLNPFLLEGVMKSAKLLIGEFGNLRGRNRSALAIKLHGESSSLMTVTELREDSPVTHAAFVVMPMRDSAPDSAFNTQAFTAP
jgi:hypothetical protein